ncbi:MAG: LemA family protein [Thermoanaerobaculia bacterium]|nr:LemA family protein [Thermoanaerobaculia bacterium]
MWVGIVLIVALVGIVVWATGLYNRLVTLRNRYENAFAQIDVQLKRRHDLIPNLVETAKGYLKHERETLEAVIQARNQAREMEQKASAQPGDARAMEQLAAAETGLTGALGRLFALREDYPELKADTQMTKLMEELTSTENKIAFARQAYNDAVTSYNTAREKYPTALIASSFGFQEAHLFEIEDKSHREAVKVQF